ncbi:uncharacterized protein LOC110990377 [Acanthaster planci]|uniref:Uncharacterized protein LOC110990377 n=1 Tax=Acanthaster planci TaxID=133434 RepID=A0A8B8A250_ACAPL|nr:uncharacterized protein LOC110990377 [Acanthaster planci]
MDGRLSNTLDAKLVPNSPLTMRVSHWPVVLATVTTLLCGVCSALKCHICDSVDGPGQDFCTEVKSGVDSTELTGNVSYTDSTCDKYCIKTEVTRGPEYRDQPDYVLAVARTCGPNCINYCYPLAATEVCIHCCKTDLCNGACVLNFDTAAISAGIFLHVVAQLTTG